MTSAPASPNSVEATTTLLKAELPRLEAHQQSLEKELAAVTERLESVRSALSALTALSGVPHVLEGAEQTGAPAAADADAEPAAGKAAAPVASVPAPRRSGAKKAAKKRGSAKKAAPERSSKPATAKKAAAKKGDESESPSGLTRQVLDILADAKGGTVRARDVAKVLGRDGSPGEINAVRSTLDRLVATSRADRAGRGLYRERA
ncbi:hypothetical protein [Streptomyces sp. NRRL F-5126]|uniref:hypothetical protein n=1 Tax=Streptomyces sp. NRRL F-5126 TaxID=1463857 RepID=UPI0004C7BACA|nr:hypothetical protein [Streptomyces sp. NRRL F-5126]